MVWSWLQFTKLLAATANTDFLFITFTQLILMRVMVSLSRPNATPLLRPSYTDPTHIRLYQQDGPRGLQSGSLR